MIMNKNKIVFLKFKKSGIVVYLNGNIFLEQKYIKEKGKNTKSFTFLYVMHILYKFGIGIECLKIEK